MSPSAPGRPADAGADETSFEQLLRGAEQPGDDVATSADGGTRPGALVVAVVVTALIGVGTICLGVALTGWPRTADSVTAAEVDADADAEDAPRARATAGPREPAVPVAAARTAPGADPVWAAETAAASGIPEVALRAYAGAALRMAVERPGCGLGWNTLAAIGDVESRHGSLGGAVLDSAGRALPRIIGVALDGERFAAVPDTDGGALDGDTVWDRAVGPMQFTPETWRLHGRDGNGDGAVDIDQLDDAALSAADLLCAGGRDLRDPQQWVDAIDGYNPSLEYNHAVADTADAYARFG